MARREGRNARSASAPDMTTRAPSAKKGGLERPSAKDRSTVPQSPTMRVTAAMAQVPRATAKTVTPGRDSSRQHGNARDWLAHQNRKPQRARGTAEQRGGKSVTLRRYEANWLRYPGAKMATSVAETSRKTSQPTIGI